VQANSDLKTGTASTDGHEVRDWGGLILAVVLILGGGYFLLRNTLGLTLPEIDWDKVWPVLVIIVGVGALLRGWTGHSHHHRRRGPRT